MADIKQKYGTADQSVTITLASLADGGYRQSAELDNTSDLFSDVLVGGKVTTGTSPTANKQIVVYAYGTVDGGTIHSGGASGSDAAYTAANNEEKNLLLLGVVATHSGNDNTYEFGPFSIAAAFGGSVPAKWGLVILNDTGAALNSTGSNHDINYQGILHQSV